MYRIGTTVTIAGAHFLNLPYESKCQGMHGHNWKVELIFKSETLNSDGMIVDFSKVKKVVDNLDHRLLNDIIPQPTAENISKFLFECLREFHIERVRVYETESNWSEYYEGM